MPKISGVLSEVLARRHLNLAGVAGLYVVDLNFPDEGAIYVTRNRWGVNGHLEIQVFGEWRPANRLRLATDQEAQDCEPREGFRLAAWEKRKHKRNPNVRLTHD